MRTYETYETLRDAASPTEFREFIRQTDVGELSEIIRSRITLGDAPAMLDEIFQAYSESEACQVKRRELVESVLKFLPKLKINAARLDAVVNRIVLDFPRYSKHQLVKLVDFCLNDVRNPVAEDQVKSWKDLLPPLLEMLEHEKYVAYMDAEMSGTEYKSLIVKSIRDCRWNIDVLPCLAKMFGDMGLAKHDRAEALSGLCVAIDRIPLDLVPPFVYQTLKLCQRQGSRYLLDALRRYFETRYSLLTISNEGTNVVDYVGRVNPKEIHDIESTVLYHVYQAAQLNHECLKDYVRHLRTISCASDYVLRPFVLAVLLSISSVYEDQAFEILRLSITNSIQEEEKRRSSAWLRRTLPSTCSVIRVIEQVIDSSNKDRRLVLKGLSDLALALIGAGQDKTVSASGAEILRELMKKRHETVGTILRESIDRIIAGGAQTAHYTDCLAYACRKLTPIVLDQQASIVGLLDRLLCLSGTVACEVLEAIFPLVQISVTIRENLVLTLRKALYRKGVSKRRMAVTGFLEMLKHSKVHSLSAVTFSQRQCHSSAYAISSSSTSTLTQVTLERSAQTASSSPGYDKSFCCEILAILKKAFTYEFEVKLHLYRGLHAVIEKDPEITQTVLEILLSHLNEYFETDENILPPIKLDLCTDLRGTEVILKEPIADLVFLLQRIYNSDSAAIQSRKSGTFDQLLDVLESLSKRAIIMELEHLNLNEEKIESSEGALKLQRRLENLKLVIAVYEALMAFEVGKHVTEKQRVDVQSINDLFKGYTRTIEFAKKFAKTKRSDSRTKRDKDASNTAARKFAKSCNVKLPDTIMDLQTVLRSFTLLYSLDEESRSWASDDGPTLKENQHFHRYMLRTCAFLLQREKQSSSDHGGNSIGLDEVNGYASRKRRELRMNACVEIGGLLYKHWIVDMRNTLRQDEETGVLALECLKELSCVICENSLSCLPRFLATITRTRSRESTESLHSQLQDVIFSLSTDLKVFLNEREAREETTVHSEKVPLLLLEIIELLTRKIDFAKCDTEKILERMRNIARTDGLPSSVAVVVLRLLLHLEEGIRDHGETLNEICLELCEKLGTVDNTELETSKRYKILRDDITLQVYSTLNEFIKEKLTNASWLLGRLKAEECVIRTPGPTKEALEETLREKERNLCKQLSYVMQMLHTLANTSIDSGTSTDLTFKNLQNLYNLLGNLTRYFHAKSSEQSAAFQAVKFIQVIQLAGKPLKSAFYNLVTHIEENQNRLHPKSDMHAQRNKVLKETKVIPRVVYEIEQFNKEVLLLAKRTNIPLESYMKHSVTRDFRIKNPQLVEGLEKLDVSKLISQNSTAAVGYENVEGSNTIDDGRDHQDEDSESGTPTKKRPKTGLNA